MRICNSTLDPRPSTPVSGVALVVTLIMLSVIAFMSITFLILTQRERGSVTTAASQTDARLAADTALERAKSELIAPVIAFRDLNAYQLSVSTNYINPAGYNPAAGASPTNVNFERVIGGAPLSLAQQHQNLANLQYNPRVPVYIVTNAATGGSDFRFYLDLNRNGRYDTNGVQPIVDNTGATNGNFDYFPGDPEWIGILERPELPHSGNNHFVARYAYVTVPAGQTLDANYIHNQTASQSLVANDGFMRNQGVGSYEINLAAFLADLNTNMWLPNAAPDNAYYAYNRPVGSANAGKAFEDAQALVRYRYDDDYPPTKTSSKNVSSLFSTAGLAAFNSDPIDRYADGPLMTTVTTNATDSASSNLRWPGAENPNHFFTLQEMFSAPYLATFSNHLWQTGNRVSTYDRSTYYRLLSQLGTESSTGLKDDANPNLAKVNLNYDNLVQANPLTGTKPDATNFISWKPVSLFTNLADRLLRDLPRGAYGDLNITNIEIYPTNHYTPAVHRLLQLAANIYDASTNRVDLTTKAPYFPHVFRPAFTRSGTGTNMQIRISGYVEETGTNFLGLPLLDMSLDTDRQQIETSNLKLNTNSLVQGVPLVIGAKIGLPNFNEFALQNAMTAARKLEFMRPNTNSAVNAINQLYVLNLSSISGIEAWNSYSNTYPRDLQMLAWTDITLVMTNELGLETSTNFYTTNVAVTIPANKWLGYTNDSVAALPSSFRIPLSNNVVFINTNLIFLQTNSPESRYAEIARYYGSLPPVEPGVFHVPRWFVNLKTTVRYALVDSGRIVDYVSLTSDEPTVDLTRKLMDLNSPGEPNGWDTNRINNTTSENVRTTGIQNQISISYTGTGNNNWKSWNYDIAAGSDKAKAVLFFHDNLFYKVLPNSPRVTITNVFYAPYVPTITLYQNVSWQANDPLVHYTKPDLTDLTTTNQVVTTPTLFVSTATNKTSTLATMNARYKPWGGNPTKTPDSSAYNLALKDPLMWRSDFWEFPTNKLPNVGWIGRVHRGTPWQTVYLKAPDIGTDPDSLKEWQKWTGNANDVDAKFARPVADRLVFDHITTAPNDNASRGTLSVNQSGLAAWSAVLSGVITLTNNAADGSLKQGVRPAYASAVIEPAGSPPAGIVPPLRRIVDAINTTRAGTNFNGSFKHVGDILAVPEFTVGAQTNYAGTFPNGYWTNASPFLNFGNPATTSPKQQEVLGLSDAAYERIPQQIMSLLRGPETRFVVYAYGQSLKPADRSVIQASGFSGMVTNYQITGEVATRSVVRIDGGTTNAHAVVESFNFLPPE